MVRVDADELILTPGRLLTLRADLTHAVHAKDEAAFLLILASETPHPVETDA